MKPFKYQRATNENVAINSVTADRLAAFLAGGTNLVDLMKENILQPDKLIDITGLDLSQIKSAGSNVSIGALATNTETANHPLVRTNFPLLSQAILSGASAQIRNMATNGGNLNQRTRCMYFYDKTMPCNKRSPGSGCAAIKGLNRMHAIFGWSDKCVAVFPSDMAVALAALNAIIKVRTSGGKIRSIPFYDYHRLPGNNPEIENNLKRGELVTSIEVPKNNYAKHSYYLKVRDRASYAFALISVAAGLEIDAGGTIRDSNIAMGGVAHKPWRATIAEKMLIGKKPSVQLFEDAATMEMERAKPLEHNKFKVELGKRAIVRTLNISLRNDLEGAQQ
ncbi:MAG: FAD binding domain-containing protein [Pyrinomonadaceae bacterium]